MHIGVGVLGLVSLSENSWCWERNSWAHFSIIYEPLYVKCISVSVIKFYICLLINKTENVW